MFSFCGHWGRANSAETVWSRDKSLRLGCAGGLKVQGGGVR